ncbi:MAG: hypothetical protein WC749_07720 [Dehalococcoidia bacterium]
MQTKTSQVAVPAAADTWTDLTAITVPAGVKSLKKVIVGVAVDEADPAGVRIAPVFRLQGAGLDEQNPHEYIAPCGNIGAKTTSGAYACELNVFEYDVDIPVTPGGVITPQVITLDEAITAGTCSIALEFSEEAPKAANSMSQYVDVTMTTTAGAWYTVGTITVPQPGKGKAPTRIKNLTLAIPTDQATIALLRCSSRFRLSGAGINEPGDHEYLGPQSGTGCNTAGILGYSKQAIQHPTDIPVNAGGQILVEHYLTTETPTAGTAILGVQYA